MANILIVTSEFLPFQSSGINRLSFFKRYLEKNGHKVFVLTTLSTAQGGKKSKQYDQSNNIIRAFTFSLLTRRLLSSKRLPLYPKLSKIGKYTEWRHFAVSKGEKIVKNNEINIVITSFPDFASVDVAEKISRRTNTPLVTDFRDPPYWIYDKLDISKKTIICKSIIERVMLTSKQIITCTADSSNSLKEYYDLSQDSIIIANGYDSDVINNIQINTETDENYFEIVHIGSFYNDGRDIKRVVDALRTQAHTLKKKIHLRLIGDEPDAKTKHYIQVESDVIKVSIEPPIPMIQALTIAKNANALLLLQGSRFDRQIPTKTYEYLALNTVIWGVIGDKGATKELLDNNATNVVYANYDIQESINLSVNTLIHKKASFISTEKYSRQAQAEKLLEIVSM